jgi:hypothetical protein
MRYIKDQNVNILKSIKRDCKIYNDLLKQCLDPVNYYRNEAATAKPVPNAAK